MAFLSQRDLSPAELDFLGTRLFHRARLLAIPRHFVRLSITAFSISAKRTAAMSVTPSSSASRTKLACHTCRAQRRGVPFWRDGEGGEDADDGRVVVTQEASEIAPAVAHVEMRRHSSAGEGSLRR
jgi:hypothetical protein